MTKNIVLTVLSLGAICASVDLKADFKYFLRVVVLDDRDKQVLGESHNIIFKADADDSITVASFKQQVIDYIKRIKPNIACCTDAYFLFPSLTPDKNEIYKDDSYRISRDEREHRWQQSGRMFFIAYTLGG